MTRAFDPYAAGVQRSTFKLGKYFSEKGIDVAYFSTKNKGNKLPEYGSLFHVQHSYDLKNNENKQFLIQTLENFRPDIVINQMPYEVKLSTMLATYKKNISYILIGCLRNSLFNFINSIPLKVQQLSKKNNFPYLDNSLTCRLMKVAHKQKHAYQLKRILDLHDYFVLLAPQNLEELQYFVGTYKNEKTLVIPNSIPEVYPEAILKKKKQLLYVGSLNVHQKRTDLLLPIWERVFKELPDWEFKIVGSGSNLPMMEKYIKRNNLKRVLLEGHQQPENYYQKASMFIMTSAYEGFPNTILEAHSYGCPTILINSYKALDWIVNDKEDALLAEAYGLDAMANHIIYLAKDSKKLSLMQKNSIENAKRFTIDKVGKQWFDLFLKIKN